MKANQTLSRHFVVLLLGVLLTYLFLDVHSDVVAHTAYFLFMHFLHFDRPLPVPNPLQWPFTGLVVAVMALQTIATVRTGRVRRNSPLRA